MRLADLIAQLPCRTLHLAKRPHIADVRASLVYEHLERRPVEPLDQPR